MSHRFVDPTAVAREVNARLQGTAWFHGARVVYPRGGKPAVAVLVGEVITPQDRQRIPHVISGVPILTQRAPTMSSPFAGPKKPRRQRRRPASPFVPAPQRPVNWPAPQWEVKPQHSSTMWSPGPATPRFKSEAEYKAWAKSERAAARASIAADNRRVADEAASRRGAMAPAPGRTGFNVPGQASGMWSVGAIKPRFASDAKYKAWAKKQAAAAKASIKADNEAAAKRAKRPARKGRRTPVCKTPRSSTPKVTFFSAGGESLVKVQHSCKPSDGLRTYYHRLGLRWHPGVRYWSGRATSAVREYLKGKGWI